MPVIEQELVSAYTNYVIETSRGQYECIKERMAAGVKSCRSRMFTDSYEKVKALLTDIGYKSKRSTSERVQRVLHQIYKYYLIVLKERPPEELMTALERQKRAEIAILIQGRERKAKSSNESTQDAIISCHGLNR